MKSLEITYICDFDEVVRLIADSTRFKINGSGIVWTALTTQSVQNTLNLYAENIKNILNGANPFQSPEGARIIVSVEYSGVNQERQLISIGSDINYYGDTEQKFIESVKNRAQKEVEERYGIFNNIAYRTDSIN
jgi:hypothetical protein